MNGIDFHDMEYVNLIKYVEESMKSLRLRAYKEGYEQGRFDERIEGSGREQHQQQRRDEIIEKAKREVEEIRNDPIQMEGLLATFVVDREKRTVTALLASVSTGVVERQGVAKCHPDDCFNVHIGKIIALYKALGLKIPYEYYNAPQPTELRVGDIVTRKTWGGGVKRVAENGCAIPDQIRIKTAEYLLRNHALKITDDSRENEAN